MPAIYEANMPVGQHEQLHRPQETENPFGPFYNSAPIGQVREDTPLVSFPYRRVRPDDTFIVLVNNRKEWDV